MGTRSRLLPLLLALAPAGCLQRVSIDPLAEGGAAGAPVASAPVGGAGDTPGGVARSEGPGGAMGFAGQGGSDVQSAAAVDLSRLGRDSTRGSVLQGADLNDGAVVAGAGDVNGDGFDDVIVAGPSVLGASPGKAYVVFGTNGALPASLAMLGAGGFVIEGENALDDFGSDVGGAGDVNGDGLDDVIVGAPSAGVAGQAYVVFGKRDAAPVSVTALAGQGFVVLGETPDTDTEYGDHIGQSARAAGDVNGDGLGDIVLAGAGRSYVVWGKADDSAVALAALGDRGFRIDGAGGTLTNHAFDDYFSGGYAIGPSGPVAAAGDVNGDGLDDVILGTPLYDAEGSAQVVFGKRDTNAVTANGLLNREGGFVVLGAAPAGELGSAVSGAGDTNGDGLDDVVVGAPRATPAGGGEALQYAGVSYVVFGTESSAPVSLALFEAERPGGFVINGPEEYAHSGRWASGVGDFDGDGLGDVVVGWAVNPSAIGCPNSFCGGAFVVFGKGGLEPGAPPETGAVSLAELAQGSPEGFSIDGSKTFGVGLNVVSAAGDFNGDGLGDVVLGAPGLGGRVSAGALYLVLGAQTPELARVLGERVVRLGDASDQTLDYDGEANALLSGGNGTDTLRYLGRDELDLRQGYRNFQALDGDGRRFVRPSLRVVKSVEVIDLTASAGAGLILDDAAVRRVPQSRTGLPGGLSKSLVVLANGTNTLRMDLSGYELLPEPNAGRMVYRRRGAFYGLELSPELTTAL